jgi:hypothetical protein
MEPRANVPYASVWLYRESNDTVHWDTYIDKAYNEGEIRSLALKRAKEQIAKDKREIRDEKIHITFAVFKDEKI